MLRSLLRNRRASISIYAAVVLPLLVGMTALGTEYATALMTQSINQRVADVAAFSGALAYNASGSANTMNAAISRIATLNGLPASSLSSGLVTSPADATAQAIQVTATTTQTLVLAQLLGPTPALTIASTAYVQIASQPACIVALNALGTGIVLGGSGAITASLCVVASNNGITVPCGSSISASAIKYNSATPPSAPCGGITNALGAILSGAKSTTVDWLSGNGTISSVSANVGVVTSLSSPAGPSLSSSNDVAFGYAASSTQAQLTASGCSGTFAGNVWTVACPAGGTYSFRNLTMSGGITVNFATTGSATNIYNFAGSINNGGTALSFGPGTYTIAGGIYTGGGSSTSFAAGTYNIGPYAATCGFAQFSICHNGSALTFAGPSTFTISNGINTNSQTMRLGTGATTNSYTIGASAGLLANYAIYVGGGGSLTLGDSSASTFTAIGNILTGGGSCLTLPAASIHNVNGSLAAAGGVTLGSGLYTFSGYFALGSNGGGDVSCNGSSVGLSASGVTIVVGGLALATGSCTGSAFCVASGFGHVTLTAPTTGTTANFAVIGPLTASLAGSAVFTEGAVNSSVSGVFYIPQGALTMAGGASIGSGVGQCLEMIASQITETGGTSLASICPGLGGNSTTARLVQ